MVEVLCIVQARLTSERLPNKVLQPLGKSDMSLLEHVYNRFQRSNRIDKTVFAITNTQSNLKLAEFLEENGIPYYSGSEDDVLERFWKTAIQESPHFIVRATCDNPLVDWELTDALVDNLGEFDWISCEDTPLGTAAEVFTIDSLREAYEKTVDIKLREHVTPYIWQNLKSKMLPWNGLQYRLTVDEPKDLELINHIYMDLYKGEPIPNNEVYQYLAEHPEIASVNQTIHQKTIGE